MKASEKISLLRTEMKAHGVDHLLVPSDDYHMSEYVSDFFRARAYLSGFTGSAGTLIVSMNEAKLFTDGRYYIQAERQLAGSGIDLMRAGSEGVPTVEEYVTSIVKNDETLAFDGRCVSASTYEKLKKNLPNAKFVVDVDFPVLVWPDRPALPCGRIWKLDQKYAGKTHAEKLADLRAKLKENDCGATVLTSLCDIAWLYNLRGSDVEDTPVFMSFCIVTENSDVLYIQKTALFSDRTEYEADGVTIRDYNDFWEDLKKLDKKTLVDKTAVSAAVMETLGDKAFWAANPTILMKSKKNPTELENLRKCHVADGLAVTKLMMGLKYGDYNNIDEYEVGKIVYSLRKECADELGCTIIGESFGTIAAFGANAAMMHYSAASEGSAKIDPKAEVPMLLVDSGGQYLEGTTDITRTFLLGEVSDEIKRNYTLTACGMLRLLNAVFLSGATGSALDIMCREPLWEVGIDYRCGTGHGVGYLLSVHEGPNRFHWQRGGAVLEEGMITTDEPGVYVEGSHGIRIENELICEKGEHNEYGQFLKFENLTFCPIDIDAIDPKYMDVSDVRKFNAYQKLVYETLAPHLCENGRSKLAYMTRPIEY